MAKVTDDVRRARAQWSRPGRPGPASVEVPGPGQESVWDYPRPPRLDESAYPVRVVLKGQVVVETRAALRVLETSHPPTYYLPPQDVEWGLLQGASGSSMCEWKGVASYWTVRAGGAVVERVGWSYSDPFDEFARVKDHVAFYCTTLECFVGGERARPQPGGFYGGWITSHVVGPFKGGAGTMGW